MKKEQVSIYTTAEGVNISVSRGSKPESKHDFIVKFFQPGKSKAGRTPKHIHLIVEMYVKHAHNPALTMKLRDHLLNVFYNIKPVKNFPPSLQYFDKSHTQQFEDLNKVGEFSVEFILVVTELIMIQEKTNYPEGSLTKKLYFDFGVKDRFSVINAATLRRF